MVQTEELEIMAPAGRRTHFGWLLPVLFRPAKTMRAVAAEERAAWYIPLLLLTALTVIFTLVAGPLRQQAALNQPFEPPPNFEYMSPEQQEQYMQAQQNGANTTNTVIFPLVGALLGLWVSWFALGAILHLALTLLGSRSTNTTAFNLAAWASIPFAIRLIVQISYLLIARQLINSPGLSGFIPADATGVLLFVKLMIAMVDIYLIWQLLLLVLGSASTPGLTRWKAFGGVLLTMLILLALAALPGFISAQLSGLDIQRSFFFF